MEETKTKPAKQKPLNIEAVDSGGKRIEFRPAGSDVAIHADKSGVSYVGKDDLREVGQWFLDMADLNEGSD